MTPGQPARPVQKDTDSTRGTMSLSRWLNTRRLPPFHRVLNAKACGHGMAGNNGWPTEKLKRGKSILPYDVANNPGR